MTTHHEHHESGHNHSSNRWARLRHALTPHSHDHNDAVQTAEEASRTGIRAAWISLVGMGATALLQIVIVWVSGSIGLLADTLHNIGHLATTIPLLLAFRLGRRAPNRRYSYGFRRAEDLVGLLIGLVIAGSAVVIIVESIQALANPRPLSNLGWVFAAGLIGAAGNEAVAVYRIRAGRRIGSAALVAEGQHARTDALTSLAVIVGVIGAWMGMPRLDAIVGLVIAAVIVAVLLATMRTVVRRLMDGIDDGTLDHIDEVASTVPGVLEVSRSRARWTGHRLEADLDVTVDKELSARAAHAIADEVHQALVNGVRHLDHATVHIIPAGRHPELPEGHSTRDLLPTDPPFATEPR